MDFDEAFTRLVGHEGGLSLDPKDRGNWTTGVVGSGQLKGSKYGISAAQYPGEDIANLTLDRAKTIYRSDYWGKAGCDCVPPTLKYALFDFAVNSGPKTAAKFLQRCVGAQEDGEIGPVTMMAIQNVDPVRLAARFYGSRLEFMTSIPSWESQGKGWARRIASELKAL